MQRNNKVWMTAGVVAALTAAGAAGLAVATSGPNGAAATPAEMAKLEAAPYEVDAGHSTVNFKVKHLNVAYQYGRFNDPKGEFRFDPETGRIDSIKISVMADAVDTNNQRRDNHLRNNDFFSAKEFPVISFESSRIEAKGTNKLNATGMLKIRGVSKVISVPIEVTGHGDDPWGGQRAGFHTEFTIDRTDFGVNYQVGPIGREVTLIVSIEGIRKD